MGFNLLNVVVYLQTEVFHFNLEKMWRWVQGADRFRGRWGGSLSLLFFFSSTVHAWRMHRTCCERHLKLLVAKLAWLRTMRTQKMTDLPFPRHLAPIMVGWKDSRIRKVTIVFRYIGAYPLFPYVPLNHDCWWGKSSHCGGKWPSSDLQEDELQRVLEDPGASQKELWREALHSVPTVLNVKTSIEVFSVYCMWTESTLKKLVFLV